MLFVQKVMKPKAVRRRLLYDVTAISPRDSLLLYGELILVTIIAR
jgi:hypothetical protein